MALILFTSGHSISADVHMRKQDRKGSKMKIIDLRSTPFRVCPAADKASAVWRAAELFVRQVQERTGVSPVFSGRTESGYALVIGVVGDKRLNDVAQEDPRLRQPKLKDSPVNSSAMRSFSCASCTLCIPV